MTSVLRRLIHREVAPGLGTEGSAWSGSARPADYEEHRAADLDPAMGQIHTLVGKYRSVTIWKEGDAYVIRGWRRDLAFLRPADGE